VTWRRFKRLRRKPSVILPTSEGVVTVYLTIVALVIILIMWAAIRNAAAQVEHVLGHNEYQNWSSRKTAYCCNNFDCGRLEDDHIRDGSDGSEVRIGGEWCPVRPEHYVVRGRSPDLSSAHACVGSGPQWTQRTPCERLLCFVDRGGV